MPGFTVAERLDVMAPHPLARLRFEGMRVPIANRLGAPGEGFKIAMRDLEIRGAGNLLGGEQSGHLVYLDHSTTGDGMLAGLNDSGSADSTTKAAVTDSQPAIP